VKIVAIIQARMGSTRLPGKVMVKLAGEPMLVRVMNRVNRAKTLDEVVVATTSKCDDDVIVDLCKARRWSFFRGSELDVLDRYYHTAKEYNADVIVRITSDCPMIDPILIDRIVNEYINCQPDINYVGIGLKQTFPRGLSAEVFGFGALDRAWKEDNEMRFREHVTQYIIRHPELFSRRNVSNSEDLSYMRWTVDTIEDLTFVRKIFTHFGHDEFSWIDVIEVLKINPDWVKINAHIEQKSV
jgi:spore coat polysaccharide biosynthesis protein SpsF